jgi:hypothetical protein
MTSSVKLISVRQIPEASAPNEFIWVCQANDEWTPFPDAKSSIIENAFRHGLREIFIDGIYRIDLNYFVQEHIDDRNRKQSIRRRRRSLRSSVSRDKASTNESRRCERFSVPLRLVSSCSASVDTNYYGSPFIAEWFLIFTKGKRNVTFDSIFPVLVQGLREEGQTESEHVVRDIVDSFNKIRDEALRKSEKKKMEELENCCAQLYTKPYFIYRIVNIALRDEDHTKLRTLGPYCFLVFNYIGRHLNDDFSVHHRLRQTFRPTRSQLMTIFRGDYISHEMIEEYRQAVGDNSKYFKWLSFVSTSRDQDIAEDFAQNILYIIELQRYSSNDQFVDMSTISSCKEEKEILLRPGVRFQVIKVEFDDMKSLHLVHINIVLSYVSSLR